MGLLRGEIRSDAAQSGGESEGLECPNPAAVRSESSQRKMIGVFSSNQREGLGIPGPLRSAALHRSGSQSHKFVIDD